MQLILGVTDNVIYASCMSLYYDVMPVPCSLVNYLPENGLTSWLSWLSCLLCFCAFFTFPYGVLGHLWYLIVSIPAQCVFFTLKAYNPA